MSNVAKFALGLGIGSVMGITLVALDIRKEREEHKKFTKKIEDLTKDLIAPLK